LLRRIRCDPGFRLGTERGFLRGVIEVHDYTFLLSFRGACQREPGISIQNYKIPGLRLTAHPGMTFKAYAALRLRMRSISASSQ
jgi:hypothetical protein